MDKDQEQIRNNLKNIRNLKEQNDDSEYINDVEINNESDEEINNELESEINKIIDEFSNQVSQVAKIQSVNIYNDNIELKGNIIQHNLEFSYSLSDGVYITGTMVELNNETIQLIDNLHRFYNQFENVFANIIY